jgi:hypothetical protein
MAVTRRKISFVFCILALIGCSVKAQMTECQLAYENLQADSNKLYLNIAHASFIKNNEYFNPIVEGYTLSGFWITPSLEYHAGGNTVLQGGIHLLKFSGRDRFFKVLPVFTFSQKFGTSVILNLGTINPNHNHFMPEPLYDPERFYFYQADNGVQILVSAERIKSDIWLSCDSFIWHGDSTQERFTSGTSSELTIIKTSSWILSLPFQTLLTHKGGQINRPKRSIETLLNAGTGLSIEYCNDQSYIRRIRFNPQFFIYKKMTDDTTVRYKKGWAFYPAIFVDAGDRLYLKLAWWYANSFFDQRGEAIYQSVSTLDPGSDKKIRNMLVGKIAYAKPLGKGILFSAGFEGYYDTKTKIFDYNFSVHLLYNGLFRLASFQQNL